MENTRVGAQHPRVSIEPIRSYTDGDNASELSSAYGNTLDEWQRIVLDCWLGRDSNGNLTAMTCGIPCPRQNGKNGIIEAFELFLLLNVPDTHILHTAHQVKTEKKAFRRLAGIFENKKHPELNRELLTVRRTNGEEAIELNNGNTIEYTSRSRGSARGFDAITCVIYDEAQELQDDHVEAIMSTLAASPTGDRQMIYAGTPPSPNAPGDVFQRVRKSSLSNPSERTAWHEWGIESDSCPVSESMKYEDVRDMVFKSNPAMGVRLDDCFTEEEFSTMSASGFARERLGWWIDTMNISSVITEAQWNACLVESLPSEGVDSLGIKYSADGATVSVSVCRKDGDAHFVELLFNESTSKGTAWLVDFIIERTKKYACAVIDGQYGAQSLMDRLDGQVPRNFIIRPKIADVISAHTTFKDYVGDGRIQHTGQPQLANSVTKSSKRAIGKDGGFGWKSNEAADASIVESAALAVHGSDKTKRNPNRKTGVAF